MTDSERWASIELPDRDDHAAVEVLHDQLVPEFPHGPRRIGYHHTVDDALAQISPDLGVAVLMPAPDVGQVLHIAGHDRLLPEKATSFQPKPSLGRAHPLAARRMTLPRATSTSTRETVAPPDLKNRRRSAPPTSTMSPSCQVGTDRFTRPDHTAHSSVSTRERRARIRTPARAVARSPPGTSTPCRRSAGRVPRELPTAVHGAVPRWSLRPFGRPGPRSSVLTCTSPPRPTLGAATDSPAVPAHACGKAPVEAQPVDDNWARKGPK